MANARSIVRARWVVPIAGDPIENGEVLVETGRVVAIGAAGTTSSEPVDIVFEFGAAAILPGLVNAHSHLELTVMRGVLEDLEFRAWIGRLMAIKAAVLTSDDFRDSARLGAAEALASGITACGDTCDSGAALDAMLETGLGGVVFQEVFGPDNTHAVASMRTLEETVEALRGRAVRSERVSIGISPHAPYSVSGELFRRATAFAVERSLSVAIHTAESAAEERFVRSGTGPFADALASRNIVWRAPGKSTIEYFDGLGVLACRPLLIHAVNATATDLGLVEAAGARVAHCPKSNAKLGHGIAPLRDILDRGIVVGLGTDSVASNNVSDILDEARTALMFARARSRGLEALTAREALRLATLGGAEALGLAAEIGSLGPGKRADLCVIALDGLHCAPVYDVEAALVFSASARDVIATFVDGAVVYDARRTEPFSNVDEARLRARRSEIRERISSMR
jgi:cytosine/adenosine deaminase-related metal-dependent hydrolase